MMDKESRERLEALLKIEKAALTEEDLAFLSARRSYLTVDQRKYYGVEPANTQVEEAPAEAEVPAPKKKK